MKRTGLVCPSRTQPFAAFIGVAFLLLCSAGTARTDSLQNQAADITVVSGRPLADAIQELQTRHGWLVTYEDSFYEFQGDITASPRRDGKTEPKVFVPRPRPFQFSYQNTDVARPTEALTALLNAYHANPDNADRFRLMQQESIYHVVPTSSRNAAGASVERQSRLDVRITLPEAERNVEDTLNLILDELSRVSGTQFALGASGNLWKRTTTRMGARDEVARDILLRTLAATRLPIFWRLLCQPAGPNSLCVLNLHILKV